MNRGRQHGAGRRGSFLFVLALISAIGPSWAANYLCPMARAESARSQLPACCAHRAASAASPVSYRVACHCPIPQWQAGAVNQALNQAEFVPAVAVAPASFDEILPSRAVAVVPVRSEIARASGPPLWVRNLSILC